MVLMTRQPNARGTGLELPPRTLLRRTGFLLAKATQRVREHVEPALAPLGIRPRHYGVLETLAEFGPLSQQSLGGRVRMDRTTMVQVVDDLERLGYVGRSPHPTDRRAHSVRLRADGRRALGDARRLLRATDAAAFAPLSASERRQLRELLARLLCDGVRR
jgi:DNA-binding MarR family transcriptional regulator